MTTKQSKSVIKRGTTQKMHREDGGKTLTVSKNIGCCKRWSWKNST